jgi:hypothetical protein
MTVARRFSSTSDASNCGKVNDIVLATTDYQISCSRRSALRTFERQMKHEFMIVSSGSMADSDVLARTIRSKIADGTLPRENPARLRTGIGDGTPCAACDRTILPSQMEVQADYDDKHQTIHFHTGCHGLWEAERNRLPQ